MPTATIEDICTECKAMRKEYNEVLTKIVTGDADYEGIDGSDANKLKGKQIELRTDYIQANASNSNDITKCLAKCSYRIKD